MKCREDDVDTERTAELNWTKGRRADMQRMAQYAVKYMKLDDLR
jgi:hypothetical protein